MVFTTAPGPVEGPLSDAALAVCTIAGAVVGSAVVTIVGAEVGAEVGVTGIAVGVCWALDGPSVGWLASSRATEGVGVAGVVDLRMSPINVRPANTTTMAATI